jgi:pyridoxal phosphate enzyme (YggS family)
MMNDVNSSPNSLKNRWNEVKKSVAESTLAAHRSTDDVTIIAVSKTHPASVLIEAVDAGISVFGENYASEICEKYTSLSAAGLTPEWHFIGHLQSNKVKLIAPFVTMIHSVDSLKLAREISKCATENNRNIAVLIQVNTSGEVSKSGCHPNDVLTLVEDIMQLPSINLNGLMTIPSFTATDDELRREFSLLRTIRDELRSAYPHSSIHHLSMGMSGDFPIAISEGATMVRIGTAIFGERDYTA